MRDIAVIMSVYIKDRLEYVKESVQSILNQTYVSFDYFISFDGPVSPDIDAYFSSMVDDRIKLFRIQKNGGLAQALNFLLEIVLATPRFELIARMDADDVSMPMRLERQRNFLLSKPEISVVGSWYEEIDENGKHLSWRKLPVDHEGLRKRYYTRTPFAHASVMYKRNLIGTAGFYPTGTILMEDNVLWGKALKKGLKFANIPEYLLKFRIDEKFYIRRSGIKYGWNFIVTRFKINKSLSFPLYSYLVLFLIGIIKMMPSFVLQYIYVAVRKY